MKINETNLTPPQKAALSKAGYESLGDLVHLSRSDLVAIRGIGPTTADAILELVDEHQGQVDGSDADKARKEETEEEFIAETVTPESAATIPHLPADEGLSWTNDQLNQIIDLDRRWPNPTLERRVRNFLVFLREKEPHDAAVAAGFDPEKEDFVGIVKEDCRRFFERVALMVANRGFGKGGY